MSTDVIPANDDEFDDFQKHFVLTVAASPSTYGHTAADVAALQAAQTSWAAKHQAHKDAAVAALHATADKNTSHDTYSELLRILNPQGERDPRCGQLGSHGPSHPRPRDDTHQGDAPHHEAHPLHPGPGRTSPRAQLGRRDDAPHRKKPHGYDAVQVFVKVGDPAPADETTCTQVARDTATPYTYEFPTVDAGKTAYWFVRWVNHKDEHGPLSALVSGRINP